MGFAQQQQALLNQQQALHSSRGKLQQIIFNFLSNAIKFSPPDGTVTLAAELDSPASTHGIARVRISVRDEGHGIAPPVTEFDGRGKDGPISMLFIELGRRDASRMLAKIRELDPHCYYVVDDIRLASLAGPESQSSDANSAVKRK